MVIVIILICLLISVYYYYSNIHEKNGVIKSYKFSITCFYTIQMLHHRNHPGHFGVAPRKPQHLLQAVVGAVQDKQLSE